MPVANVEGGKRKIVSSMSIYVQGGRKKVRQSNIIYWIV